MLVCSWLGIRSAVRRGWWSSFRHASFDAPTFNIIPKHGFILVVSCCDAEISSESCDSFLWIFEQYFWWEEYPVTAIFTGFHRLPTETCHSKVLLILSLTALFETPIQNEPFVFHRPISLLLISAIQPTRLIDSAWIFFDKFYGAIARK